LSASTSRISARAANNQRRVSSSSPSRDNSRQDCPRSLITEEYEDSGDDVVHVASVGDRIEGIRACLQARMGPERFQKLHRSLSDSGSLAATMYGFPDALEELPYAPSSDNLAPLVAKLVECETRYFS
jgi:hypothetical protein